MAISKFSVQMLASPGCDLLEFVLIAILLRTIIIRGRIQNVHHQEFFPYRSYQLSFLFGSLRDTTMI